MKTVSSILLAVFVCLCMLPAAHARKPNLATIKIARKALALQMQVRQLQGQVKVLKREMKQLKKTVKDVRRLANFMKGVVGIIGKKLSSHVKQYKTHKHTHIARTPGYQSKSVMTGLRSKTLCTYIFKMTRHNQLSSRPVQ